jgi:hypothetical protein
MNGHTNTPRRLGPVVQNWASSNANKSNSRDFVSIPTHWLKQIQHLIYWYEHEASICAKIAKGEKGDQQAVESFPCCFTPSGFGRRFYAVLANLDSLGHSFTARFTRLGCSSSSSPPLPSSSNVVVCTLPVVFFFFPGPCNCTYCLHIAPLPSAYSDIFIRSSIPLA